MNKTAQTVGYHRLHPEWKVLLYVIICRKQLLKVINSGTTRVLLLIILFLHDLIKNAPIHFLYIYFIYFLQVYRCLLLKLLNGNRIDFYFILESD